MRYTKIIAFASLIVIAIVLAVATIAEKIYGTAFAHEWFYGSIPFVVLWGILALFATIYMCQQKLFRRPITFALHAALLLILCGALVTHIAGKHGRISLRLNETQSAFINDNGDTETLPFTLCLKQFQIVTYPGTQSPMDYVSEVAFTADGADSTQQISMNHIADFAGYRFCQAGFDSDGEGVHLTVSRDLWGIGITYAGYALLALAMLAFLLHPRGHFRLLMQQLKNTRTLLIVVLLCVASAQAFASTPQAVSSEVADEICDLYVLYNGRICPMQTLAKDFTTKIYGRPTYQGLTSQQVFVSMLFYPMQWADEPIIKLKRGKIHELLAVDDKYASLSDFIESRHEESLMQAVGQIQRTGDYPDKKSVIDAYEKYNLLLMLHSGQLLKIYPYKTKQGVAWFSQADNLPLDMDNEQWMFIKKSFSYISELVLTHQDAQLQQVIDKIKRYQQNVAGDALPSQTRFNAECFYNALDYNSLLVILLLCIGIVALGVYVYCWLHGVKVPRWAQITLMVFLALVLAYLLVLFALRWLVSGHLPLANGYETMQFMALCTIILTFCLYRRFELLLPFGYLLAGFTLLVSTMGQSNPQITPLVPVLASPLLSLHVAVIMLSYVLLAFMMLNGLTACGIHAFSKNNSAEQITKLYSISRLLLYPALFLLTAGIFIGAVWANVSWGCYWSWDPKEVWALITMLIYALPVHSQSLSLWRKPMAFHIYAVLAFLTVLMTYFGVNFVLGGMHSYAVG